MVCVVGRMRDLILQLSKSSIYSTKPQNLFLPPQELIAMQYLLLPRQVRRCRMHAHTGQQMQPEVS
ncbi:hypothetical protein POV14_12940, partial [Klebsiella variicola]